MNQFVALRFDHIKIHQEKLNDAIGELERTSYSLKAKDEDAPRITHCITAVRYLVLKSTGFSLPHAYIGDFMHDMLFSRIAGSRLVPLDEHALGDLVFFHRKSLAHKAYMISHVGMFLDDNGCYFHSSPKGGKVDNIVNSISKGAIVTCDLAIRRTDPRSF